ncbi:MAG: Gfo/Idh/MocA family oxidoreductase [Phycisphaerae bacterium]|nr:Gfo/Idh/MocA family oxidoreductase [Phycisphaerae bacterium]
MNKAEITRREFCASAGAAVMLGSHALAEVSQEKTKPVRIGVIGVGGRGTGLLKVMLSLPGVEVPVICDINEANLNRATEIVKRIKGNPPEGFSKGPHDYRRMLQRDDFDAVLIATPAPLHAEMAADTLKAGKHCGSEVPGAYTMDECWQLVKTKEQTGKRYMLLENYCYAQQRMMVLNMVRKGVFGETYYAECSYIHDCSSLRFKPDGSLTWRGEVKRDLIGNLYPTHSLGPVSKWMNINRGDRMTSLVSSMSKPAALHAYAVKRFGKDSDPARLKFRCGDMSVTLIKTAQDRLITVYYDSDSPRPASIFYLIQGTDGVYDSRSGVYIEGKSPAHRWEPVSKYQKEYEHEYWKTRGDAANKTGHGGGDYFVLSDFVEMARHDREPFVDVCDSATWSSVMPLSKKSIEKGSASVEIPDFTGGKWKNA